jgi:thioredoxin reductase (NADPH)
LPQKTDNDVIVIGAGPAGIAASVFLCRAGYSVLLPEKNKPGGLLANAHLVENYPGFPDGISGRELVRLFTKQLEKNRIYYTRACVNSIGIENDGIFSVSMNSGISTAKSVIIATGTKPETIALEGLDTVKNRVFFEPVEIPEEFFSGKRFLIIGGGDAAFDYSLHIHSRGGDPVILSRSSPKCLNLLIDRVNKNKIPHYSNLSINHVIGKNNAVLVNCNQDDKTLEFESDYILIACGRKPDIPEFDESLKNRMGYRHEGIKTPVPGLFFAGDVIRGKFRQAGIATGDGIYSAMLVCDYLKNMR